MEEILTATEQEALNSGKCPDCSGQLYITARGGLALNLECSECHNKFWAAPLFPAKRLRGKEGGLINEPAAIKK